MSLPATQAKMSCLTAPNQLGLQIVRTREAFGSVYQAESPCGSRYLRCLNWFKQAPWLEHGVNDLFITETIEGAAWRLISAFLKRNA